MSATAQAQPERSVPTRALLYIVVLATLIRLIWAVMIPVVPMSDSHAYDVFARTLVEHGVFGWTADRPFAFWPPGTSFLYAAVYRVIGMHYAGIVGLNILLSVVMIVSTARVAMRWFGERAALAAAGILAVWPTLVFFTTILASELPYLALTIVALDVWTLRDRSLVFRAVITGLLLAFASLVRSQALVLPIVYALGLWLWQGGDRKALAEQMKLAALATVVVLLAISPWTLRNYKLYGAPVLVSTNGGITLWMGNSPGSKGDFVPIPERLGTLNDYQQSQVLGEEAKQFILSDPTGFAIRTVKKLVYLFANESIGVTWNAEGIRAVFGDAPVLWLKRFSQLSWAAIFLISVYGFGAVARQDGWKKTLLSPVALTIAFYALVHSLLVSQDRYHLAFAVQIAMLGGCGVTALAARFKRVPSVQPA